MNSQAQRQPPPNVSKRSVLLPLGIVLIAVGILVPRPLGEVARGMESGLKSIALILTDVFSLCFFGGVGCIIIGLLRNRNLQRLIRR